MLNLVFLLIFILLFSAVPKEVLEHAARACLAGQFLPNRSRHEAMVIMPDFVSEPSFPVMED